MHLYIKKLYIVILHFYLVIIFLYSLKCWAGYPDISPLVLSSSICYITQLTQTNTANNNLPKSYIQWKLSYTYKNRHTTYILYKHTINIYFNLCGYVHTCIVVVWLLSVRATEILSWCPSFWWKAGQNWQSALPGRFPVCHNTVGYLTCRAASEL